MNIALIGYGKMGQRIHALAKNAGVNVGLVVIGKLNREGVSITPQKFAHIDLAIDFSSPAAVMTNIEKLTDLKIPVVVGTTGWLTEETRTEVEQWCSEKGSTVLYGSNFSLGVQLFLNLVKRAGEMMADLPDFVAGIHEVHHMDKADAPSGTAVTAASLWLENKPDMSAPFVYGIPPTEKPSSESLYVTAQRLPGVIGEHELRIRSPFDDIRISHTALTRDAFASGALKAATWLKRQQPGFYLIENVVEDVLKSN